MNNVRRKSLREVVARIESLKSELNCVLYDLEVLRDEEEEYLENIPENLQSSERYERAESSCECLNDAFDCFEDLIEELDDIVENIENSME